MDGFMYRRWMGRYVDRLNEYMNRQMKDGWVGRWGEMDRGWMSG